MSIVLGAPWWWLALPAMVLDLPFTSTTMGDHTLEAPFSNAGYTGAATLTVVAAGDLVGYLSDDRTQEDATGSRRVPCSTPISGYREVDGVRVGARGDANWVEASGEWTYGEVTVRAIAVLVEVAVLGCNRGRCPLTDVAARFTEDRAPNFDIYLPRVLVRWNKAVFGTIYLAAVLYTLWRWWRTHGL